MTKAFWIFSFVFRNTIQPLQLLLELGVCDVNYRDHLQRTAIFAFSHGFSYFNSIPCENACLLLQHGLRLDFLDKDGNCPKLMENCRHGEDCPLLNHFKKLKLLGYQLDNKVLRTLLSEAADLYLEHVSTNLEHATELEELKRITICCIPRTTLYDVLFMRTVDLSSFAKNKLIDELFQGNQADFRNQFPHFGFVLNRNYQELTKKREVLGVANEKFKIVTDDKVLEELYNSILRYLNNDDLNILSEIELSRD